MKHLTGTEEALTEWQHHCIPAGVGAAAEQSTRLHSDLQTGSSEAQMGPGLPQRTLRSLRASETPGKPTLPSLIQTSRLLLLLPQIRLCQEIRLKFSFLPVLKRNSWHSTRGNLELVCFSPHDETGLTRKKHRHTCPFIRTGPALGKTGVHVKPLQLRGHRLALGVG